MNPFPKGALTDAGVLLQSFKIQPFASGGQLLTVVLIEFDPLSRDQAGKSFWLSNESIVQHPFHFAYLDRVMPLFFFS